MLYSCYQLTRDWNTSHAILLRTQPPKTRSFKLRIAKEGGFSGMVFHIGLAEKYMQRSHEKALAMTNLMLF